MKSNKILLVDFRTGKVTGAYTNETGQTFRPLPAHPIPMSSRRVVEAVERLDQLMAEMRALTNKKED